MTTTDSALITLLFFLAYGCVVLPFLFRVNPLTLPRDRKALIASVAILALTLIGILLVLAG
jgi:hypothetical protein